MDTIILLLLLTTGAFYLIAEIDMPGAGIIRVNSDGLLGLKNMFFNP